MKKTIFLLAIILLSSCTAESKQESSDMQFASFYEGSPQVDVSKEKKIKTEEKSNFTLSDETDNFACEVTCTEK